MADQQQKEHDAPQEAPSSSWSMSSLISGKLGKTFLLAGIVLVQAVAAYAIINSYYPSLKNFAASQSSGDYVYYEFENIVVNTAGTNETHFLVMDLSVKTDDKDALSILKLKKDEVKDHINTLMSGHSIEELKSPEKQASFKKKLTEAIDSLTGEKMVRNLFFTKYILQ